MAWDTEMALAIKNTARKAAKSLPKGWYRAEVLQVTPKLIFSVVSKEFQFSTGDGLIMTATATGERRGKSAIRRQPFCKAVSCWFWIVCNGGGAAECLTRSKRSLSAIFWSA